MNSLSRPQFTHLANGTVRAGHPFAPLVMTACTFWTCGPCPVGLGAPFSSEEDRSLAGSSSSPEIREAPLALPPVSHIRRDNLLPSSVTLTVLFPPRGLCSPSLDPGSNILPPPSLPPSVLHAIAGHCPAQDFHGAQELGVAFKAIEAPGDLPLLLSPTVSGQQHPVCACCTRGHFLPQSLPQECSFSSLPNA